MGLTKKVLYSCDYLTAIYQLTFFINIRYDGYKISCLKFYYNSRYDIPIDELANCIPTPPEEIIDFILDRPFIFAITTDSIPLFMGTVNNP